MIGDTLPEQDNDSGALAARRLKQMVERDACSRSRQSARQDGPLVPGGRLQLRRISTYGLLRKPPSRVDVAAVYVLVAAAGWVVGELVARLILYLR